MLTNYILEKPEVRKYKTQQNARKRANHFGDYATVCLLWWSHHGDSTIKEGISYRLFGVIKEIVPKVYKVYQRAHMSIYPLWSQGGKLQERVQKCCVNHQMASQTQRSVTIGNSYCDLGYIVAWIIILAFSSQ